MNKTIGELVEDVLSGDVETRIVGRVIHYKTLVIIRDLENLNDLTEEEFTHASSLLENPQAERPTLVLTTKPCWEHSSRILPVIGDDHVPNFLHAGYTQDQAGRKRLDQLLDDLVKATEARMTDEVMLSHQMFPLIEHTVPGNQDKIPGMQRGGLYGRVGHGPMRRKRKR